MTQQTSMYTLIMYGFLAGRNVSPDQILVAIYGAGPPATMEASW